MKGGTLPPLLASLDLPASAVSRMLDYTRSFGRDPRDLISLVRGEPDSLTPAYIRQAMWEALEAGYTHYPVVHGYLDLRQAVALRFQADYAIEVNPEREILITTGGTAGMYVALLAILRPGDQVLIPDPVYDPYASQIRAAGGQPVSVRAERDNAHFYLPIESLRAVLTPAARAIILNTPWNPTGSVLSKDELLAIGEFAIEHGLFVIVDEIYEKLVYDGHVHHCLAGLSADVRPNVITVNSFSKTYAMTGWRLGYNFASPEVTKRMVLHYGQFSRGSPAFVQRAGIAALRGPQEQVADMVLEYTERRRLMVEGVRTIPGVECLAPEGTFFCLVDTRQHCRSSEDLARYLVREWGLLTVPGSYYGPSIEGFLRLSFSYARDSITAGLDLLAQALQRLAS